MSIEQKIFERAKIDFDKLKAFGFVKSGNLWTYGKTFMDGDFKAVVQVDASGKVTGNVYETDSDDIYFPLRVESMAVGFAGEVRGEYEKILQDIKEHCCHINYFVSPQANRLSLKIYEKYGDNPVFPWDDFSGGVFKNPINGKWYAIVMYIDGQKVDSKLTGKVEAMNFKLDPDEVLQLHGEKGFYPAYHMNKKSWITVVLNDTVSDETILTLLEESHEFTLRKHAKSKNGTNEWLIPANPHYFDIEAAFAKNKEIIWKQSSAVNVGDIAYMYVGAPVSAVLYKCEITEVDIPYDYADENLKITHVMKIKRLKKYGKDFMPFARLKEFGVNTVCGPRLCPKNLVDMLK